MNQEFKCGKEKNVPHYKMIKFFMMQSVSVFLIKNLAKINMLNTFSKLVKIEKKPKVDNKVAIVVPFQRNPCTRVVD